jgi:hypothetical protein
MVDNTKHITKKRKVGRPKKRGPKKKRKSRAKRVDRRTLIGESKQYNFKLVSCHNGKQDRYIGIYRTIEEAYAELHRLISESNMVQFPQRNTSLKKIINSEYVYLLLERNRNGDKKNSRLKNNIGKLVEHKTNSKRWVIIDKEFYDVEETFWVYGNSPKYDRKTYSYILSMLCGGVDSKYDFKRVIQYKNKVLFKDDESVYDIIFCKNISDSVRLYNKLREDVIGLKIKNIYFIGSYDRLSPKRKELEEDLVAQTGWTKRKIQKRTT